MDKPAIKAAKMAMEADGNIIGVSFIANTEKSLADKLGTMFGIVEIYNANSGFVDAFMEALDDLRTEYYLPPHNLAKGIEKRFEEALARANRRLQAAVTQSIEEIDLRNISAVIGILAGNQIYAASVGHIKGFFFRRKKNLDLAIVDILASDGEKRYRPEPEKIFSNILNGELSGRDALLFCNEEFLAFFSQAELGEISLANTAEETAQFLDASLKEKVAKKNFYAIALRSDSLVQELPAERTAGPATKSQQAPYSRAPRPKPKGPQDSLDQLLITQVRTEKYLSPSLMPNWQKALVLGAGQIKKAGKFIGAKSVQAAAAAKAKAAEMKSAKPALPKTPTIGMGAEDHGRPASAAIGPASRDGSGIGSSRIQQTALAESDYEAASTLADDFNEQAEIEEVENAVIAMAETGTADTNSGQAPQSRPEMIHNVMNASNFGDAELSKPRPAAKPPTRDRLSETALARKANLWINNQIENFLRLRKSQQAVLIAIAALVFIFAQSVVIIGRSYDKSGSWPASASEETAKKIDSLLSNAEAQNIFSDEAKALESLHQAQQLFSSMPKRAFNKSARESLLAKINATANLLEKKKYLDSLPAAADFGGINLVGLAKTGNIYWAFDNYSQSLIRLDPASGQKAAVTTTMANIARLSAIDDKNLILLTAGGSYYRYDIAKRSATPTKPSKDPFKIKAAAPASPMVSPAIASSTISMSAAIDNYSFYLDAGNSRLIVFDKDKILKRQFVSPAFASSSAFAASYKDKKTWIYSQGKIFAIDLDF